MTESTGIYVPPAAGFGFVEERASMTPWSQFTQADYSVEQWRRACLLDRGGNPDSKDNYGLPVREPSGALNVGGVLQAEQRLGQVQGISEEKRAELARMIAGLVTQCGNTPSDALKRMAGGMSGNRSAEAAFADAGDPAGLVYGADVPPGPIEFRESAIVGEVNHRERIITTIAVPYEQSALVPGGVGFGRPGEVWNEIFCRSAFEGIDRSPHRVKANRDHDKTRLVGKVVAFDPGSSEGLISETRISKTPLGDETLALAEDKVVGASVGFAIRPSDQRVDNFSKTRRITHAYVDHLSFVQNPAFAGAQVLSVRHAEAAAAASQTRPVGGTPCLDEVLRDPVFRVDDWLNRSRP